MVSIFNECPTENRYTQRRNSCDTSYDKTKLTDKTKEIVVKKDG